MPVLYDILIKPLLLQTPELKLARANRAKMAEVVLRDTTPTRAIVYWFIRASIVVSSVYNSCYLCSISNNRNLKINRKKS